MISLRFKFRHHSPFTSYYRLGDYRSGDCIDVDSTFPEWFYWLRFPGKMKVVYWWRQFYERRAFRLLKRNSARCLHYFYPEQSVCDPDLMRGSSANVIFSCHLPVNHEFFSGETSIAFRRTLERVQGIIVMSPDLVQDYERLAPQAKVRFIPHGIDEQYFAYEEYMPNQRKPSILIVGSMMRDFERIGSVIRLSVEQNQPFSYDLVISKDAANSLRSSLEPKELAVCRFHRGISDQALVDLYHRSSLLFLPLVAATANNAVLEAMAMGLPVLTSDFSATRAYGADTILYCENANSDQFWLNVLDSALSEQEKLRSLSRRARLRIETKLGWKVIAKRIEEEFSELL